MAVEFFKELMVKFGSVLVLPLALLLGRPNAPLQPSPSPVVIISPSPKLSPSPSSSPSALPSAVPSVKPKPKSSVVSKPTALPLPSLTPRPTPVTGQQLDEWFNKYSQQYAVDRQKLWQIAVCESNLNPQADNAPYLGLFQFTENAWRSTRKQINMDPNPDLRLNPEEAIKTAAFKIAIGGIGAWPNCGK